MEFVLNMSAVMLIITAVGALAACSSNIISSTVSQKFGAELRSDLFKKIHTFSFYNIDKFETASLITRLTNDVTQVQVFANGMMRIFIKAPILCVGSFVMAVRLNPRMSIVLTVIVPIIGVLIFMNMKIGYPFLSKFKRPWIRLVVL